ncbi:hypothetical protein BN1013_00790 [Candidatus Rubidus massiliensis]|nr:hypothetical protein BN1013_00790 [Candidatus Rubidus massiliensis]
MPKELSEKDFIQDNIPKKPKPFWFWVFVLTVFVLSIYTLISIQTKDLSKSFEHNRFLQVTNREISLFLWQFPEYMRANIRQKTGYLPAFQGLSGVTMLPELADDYASAPPDVLYMYHTWKRLLGNDWMNRPIYGKELKKFLTQLPEWTPSFWKKAPDSYKKIIDQLDIYLDKNLNELSFDELPLMVRQAFQGWKNFFIEGDEINQLRVEKDKLITFLHLYPNYQRNYWFNLIKDRYPNYLKFSSSNNLPKDTMAPFLKVAYFNFFKAKEFETKKGANE